ncbi:uroporphyrinogen-III synthase [Paenibacillus oenotherae]|uniref:Uroporphyrinogen-III synthase n=1 Tax=Paenibacillus oenotherae TaxID=1435645 RepID=A0ABS7D1A6_9BACL|nr:uroporphyrinogen-III synthase [Paenibacillus oenotherae]MBW7473151.1 uroporphyrinogen-III synthase [Paenibacillus oenotherae]
MGTPALRGRRVVITGSQKTNEMSIIIEKQGGTPIIRPLQGITIFEEAQLAEPLRQFVREGADWVILTTGRGADSLVEAAERLGIDQQLQQRLTEANIASRGYKTSAFLKRKGLRAVMSDDDGTMGSLVQKLDSIDFGGKRVWIQLHGEPSPELEQLLTRQGASQVQSVLPYRHIPPEKAILETLLSEVEAGSIDAVCFTTAVQVRYLFRYAMETGRDSMLRAAFNSDVLAAAVGKVTAGALEAYGMERVIVPAAERMGAMIVEISRYYEAAAAAGKGGESWL